MPSFFTKTKGDIMLDAELMSFKKAKEMINTIAEEQIIQFEGATLTQCKAGEQTISTMEVKIAFTNKSTEKHPE
jgi:hypothetical protein